MLEDWTFKARTHRPCTLAKLPAAPQCGCRRRTVATRRDRADGDDLVSVPILRSDLVIDELRPIRPADAVPVAGDDVAARIFDRDPGQREAQVSGSCPPFLSLHPQTADRREIGRRRPVASRRSGPPGCQPLRTAGRRRQRSHLPRSHRGDPGQQPLFEASALSRHGAAPVVRPLRRWAPLPCGMGARILATTASKSPPNRRRGRRVWLA